MTDESEHPNPIIHGTCPECGKYVYAGNVRVASDGERWHPACRVAWYKAQTQETPRRGRPKASQSAEVA